MSRRRTLHKQDAELWSRVTSTVRPIHAERLIPQRDHQKGKELEPDRSNAKDKGKEVLVKPVAALPSYTPPVSVPRAPGSGLERTAYKRLAKGKSTIEARIDLHGMTQSVAHHRLANFLAGARADGLRHVLVITGKGASSGGDGVLRRMVPLWLHTEPMKHDVSAFSAAARHHGGEGALYVRLKRR